MTVKQVNDEIAKLQWFAKVVDKMTDNVEITEPMNQETFDILMDMVEQLPSIACTMAILLDNSELRRSYD